MNRSRTNPARLPLLLAFALAALAGCHTVSSVTPNPGSPGGTITIAGNGFGNTQATTSKVLYGGAELLVRSWSNTQIVADLPCNKPTGTYGVQVALNTDVSAAVNHNLVNNGSLQICNARVVQNANNKLSAYIQFDTTIAAAPSVQVAGPDGTYMVPSGGILSTNPGTTHKVGVLGMFTGGNYAFTAFATSGTTVSKGGLSYVPPQIPHVFPLVVNVSQPAEMEPGVTLFSLNNGLLNITPNNDGLYALDAQGRVVWYYRDGKYMLEVQRLANGHILIMEYGGTMIYEIDVWGNILNTYLPASIGVNLLHHDVITLPGGNYLTFSIEMRSIGGYPAGPTGCAGGVCNVVGDIITEFTPAGALVSQIKMLDILDPHRIPQMELFNTPLFNTLFGNIPTKDWSHCNGLQYSAGDDSLIVSCRSQDMVFKIRRSDSSMVWVLGSDDASSSGDDAWPFLTLTGPGMLQAYSHSPRLLANGNILLYDNGDYRPTEYTRLAEFAIDEPNLEVQQVWEWVDPDYVPPLYAYFSGGVELEPGGTALQCDGGLLQTGNVNYVRLAEVNRTTFEKVFEVTIQNPSSAYISYRAQRVPTLYPP
ncbi:MAG: aryl-sulfate sulfotransferase [bacterium]